MGEFAFSSRVVIHHLSLSMINISLGISVKSILEDKPCNSPIFKSLLQTLDASWTHSVLQIDRAGKIGLLARCWQ
jgi:hypothetical protein